MLPGFKTAPAKFAEELAENSANDPEPAFLKQFIAGDRAIDHRRKGELAISAAIGVITAGCLSVFGFFFPLIWVLCGHIALALAVGARGLYLLWDSKMADIESRAFVAQNEAKIRILSDEEIEDMEQRKRRGIEMSRKAS